MTIKQASERLNFMIQQHETEVELEALRMAVQALKEKSLSETYKED